MTRRALLRDRALLALLARDVISTAGSQMTWVALPWFVLTTTGSATKMALVVAAEAAGVGIVGFAAGTSWVARPAAHDARRRRMPCAAEQRFRCCTPPTCSRFPSCSCSSLPSAHSERPRSSRRPPRCPRSSVRTKACWGRPTPCSRQRCALRSCSGRCSPASSSGSSARRPSLHRRRDVRRRVRRSSLCSSRARAKPDTEESRGLGAGVRFLLRDRLLRPWSIAVVLGDTAWLAFFVALPYPS